MKIIDQRRGTETPLHVMCQTANYRGETSYYMMVAVDERMFSADAFVQLYRLGPNGMEAKGTVVTVPMTVRWMHPNFLFQKVAFFEL